MADHCARCGQKVKSRANWMRIHLWASTAVFHYGCFIALLKTEGRLPTERATWQAERDEHANK
jgi:hypothetical protein